MNAPVIPDWLALPLLNVKMATVGKVSDDLRWEADVQLLRAIETRLEMAREEVRQQVRRAYSLSTGSTP